MYAILCSAQLDGIAAAAILFRAARLRKIEPKIAALLTHDNASEVFSEITAQKGQLFFILDLLPNNLSSLAPVFEKLTKNNRIAYWNSHHPYDSKTSELLKKFAHTVDLSGPIHYGAVPKEKLCSAELVQKRFLPNDEIAKTLAKLAHDIEFWERKDERAQKLADLLAAGFDAKELAEILSRGVFWSTRFDKIREEYSVKREKALAELMKKAIIRKYLNYNFAFTIAPSILTTADAGQKILDSHSGVDISFVLYRNGKISLRKRNDCDLNLAKIAEIFDGGGHSYAAGAKLSTNITNDTFEKTLFLIDRSLKDFFFS